MMPDARRERERQKNCTAGSVQISVCLRVERERETTEERGGVNDSRLLLWKLRISLDLACKFALCVQRFSLHHWPPSLKPSTYDFFLPKARFPHVCAKK